MIPQESRFPVGMLYKRMQRIHSGAGMGCYNEWKHSYAAGVYHSGQ